MPTCCVAGCTSGYRANKTSRHSFWAPRDPDLRAAWDRAIPRRDRKLSDKSRLCDLHFQPEDILKTYTHIIDGKKGEIARGKWSLAEGSQPKVFPNLPTYLSKPPVKKRKLPDRERPRPDTSARKKDRTDLTRVSEECASNFDVPVTNDVPTMTDIEEYGFNKVALEAIQAYFNSKPGSSNYGTLLIDEMKLRESVECNPSTYKFDGFVDFSGTAPEANGKLADHALVVMFVPIFESWVQPVASFATKGAAPGVALAKMVLESVLQLEHHGVSVVAVVSDVCFDHYKQLYKTEENNQLKVVQKLTASHINPSNLQKMNVRLATQLFSRSVALGLRYYREKDTPGLQDSLGTEEFTLLVNNLFDALNAKIPDEGIRINSPQIRIIEEFLEMLNSTEKGCKDNNTKMFTSQMTAESLRVTLMSVLDIVEFLHSQGVRYVLTAKLNQDPLEVVAVTSDMGSGNRAMWQHFDIYSGRYSRTTNKIPHPPQPGEPIVFFADVPHLIKNLNGHLVRGQTIVLPADVVTANNLTCPTVSLDPIRQLVEFQKNLTFKLVPKLRPELLDPNHFEKMKDSCLREAGRKWCIASPGGPRRVQTYPRLGSTTTMSFSLDTGKPRTARRGQANPHGSGSVVTPLTKHLLSQDDKGFIRRAAEGKDSVSRSRIRLACLPRFRGLGVVCRKHFEERDLAYPVCKTVRSFKCDICQEKYTTPGNLRKHKKIHDTTQKYKCPQCPKEFTNNNYMLKHIKRVHTRDFKYGCSYCPKRFQEQKRFQQHMVLMHAGELTPDDYDLMTLVKKLQCGQCSFTTYSTKSFRQHEVTHTGKYPYTCSECSKGFTFRFELAKHVRCIHNAQSFRCNRCKRTFTAEEVYKVHKEHHDRGLGMTCPECGNMYETQGHYEQHMQAHSKELPYECVVCKKRFALTRSLNLHRLSHDKHKTPRFRAYNGNRNWDYYCELCQVYYKYGSSLVAHRVCVHGNGPQTTCPYCDKKFNSRLTLSMHLRTHTRERPMRCSYCGKTFRVWNSLKRHVVTNHTKDFKLFCALCNKGFVSKSYLKVHLKSAHKAVMAGSGKRRRLPQEASAAMATIVRVNAPLKQPIIIPMPSKAFHIDVTPHIASPVTWLQLTP
ncbi:hypothetical protein HPB47_006512 [Ixodes persulcatus]|uniref:Uncharacterized protein n=1 Tax=Ixodes persulcatus TaxID=34615 RepID=A0AC60PAL3_IXOPE|nr:hypothetical protein HPB47_006512 [Ixodes persulcatus]